MHRWPFQASPLSHKQKTGLISFLQLPRVIEITAKQLLSFLRLSLLNGFTLDDSSRAHSISPGSQIGDMEFVFKTAALNLAMINYARELTASIVSDEATVVRWHMASPIDAWVKRSAGRSFTDTDTWRKTIKFKAALEELAPPAQSAYQRMTPLDV